MSLSQTSTMSGSWSVAPTWLIKLGEWAYRQFVRLANISGSDAHWMATSVWEERGLTLIDVLDDIYIHGPLALRSDFAREHQACVAALSSRGLITNLDRSDCVTNVWRITHRGHAALIRLSLMECSK